MLYSQFTLVVIHLHRFWSKLIEHVWKSLQKWWRNNTHTLLIWFIVVYAMYNSAIHSIYNICDCSKTIGFGRFSASNREIKSYVDDLYGNVILNNLQKLYEVFEFHDILVFAMIVPSFFFASFTPPFTSFAVFALFRLDSFHLTSPFYPHFILLSLSLSPHYVHIWN